MRYLKQKIIDVSLEVGTLVVIEILMVFDTVVYGLLRVESHLSRDPKVIVGCGEAQKPPNSLRASVEKE